MPSTIAIDFDGVVNSYSSGWTDGRLPDPPNPGAFDFIRALRRAGHTVVIHTTRAGDGAAIGQIQQWLRLHGLEETHVQAIVITSRKVPARLYIDDRGFRFVGAWPTMEEVTMLARNPGRYGPVEALQGPTEDEPALVTDRPLRRGKRRHAD